MIRDRVLTYLRTGATGTASEIARVVGANRGSTDTTLKRLYEAGYVVADKQMGRGRPGNCYSIHPNAPQDELEPEPVHSGVRQVVAHPMHVERALAARHPLALWVAEVQARGSA